MNYYSTLYTPDVRERLQKKLGPRVKIEQDGAFVIATVLSAKTAVAPKKLDTGDRMSSTSTLHFKI